MSQLMNHLQIALPITMVVTGLLDHLVRIMIMTNRVQRQQNRKERRKKKRIMMVMERASHQHRHNNMNRITTDRVQQKNIITTDIITRQDSRTKQLRNKMLMMMGRIQEKNRMLIQTTNRQTH
jgi:hypothetical protein